MAKHLQESNLNNKSYDILKWVALVALPAASALYLTLAGLWHLPYPTEIAGTLAAVDTFLRTRVSTPPSIRVLATCCAPVR